MNTEANKVPNPYNLKFVQNKMMVSSSVMVNKNKIGVKSDPMTK